VTTAYFPSSRRTPRLPFPQCLVWLEGKYAVVTGAAAGIGQAIVETFVREGARVEAIDLHTGAAGAHIAWSQFDVSDADGWTTFAARRGEAPVDVLVNNAGVSGLRPFDQVDLDFWRKFQRVNVEAALLGVQALYPALKRSEAASVVNIGSLVGLRPAAMLPAYTASKGALINLTKSLALQFAERGERIRCNLVHPGSTMTEMMRANLGDTEEEREANLAWRMSVHPYAKSLGRLPAPDDIANAVLFLASNEAAYVTGADLPVDGGASI
ncbi:MAG: SDR family oxidoreductase, partial [Pseudomonadota bacterium]